MSRTELLLFLNAAHFLTHYGLLIFPTAALAIAPAWGMTFADVLLLGSPLYVAFALGTLPAGWLGDRYDRLALIAVAFLGIGGSCLAIALSSGPVSLAAGLGALGLFASLYHPVGLALVTDGKSRSGRALAVNGVFGNLGLAGAAAATGVLAQVWHWQAAFAVPGTIALLIGGLLFARSGLNVDRRCPARAPSGDGPSPGSLPHQRTVFLVVCVSALLGGLIFNMVTIALPKFLDERLARNGIDLAWIGLSTGLVFAVAAIAQLPVGELLDRIGARPVLTALLTAQAALFLALSQAAGWSALVLALLAVTCLFAEIPITTWLLGRHLSPGIRSRAISVEYTLSLGVGSVAAPLLAVLHGAGIGFFVQFVGLALCACVVLVASRCLPAQSPSGSDRPI
ncbi:MFS transporter [Thalassobaculum salexigens]|uniref:MFS transporter n=1 Tax=Thalassobaculum salexigens TaxID=455360 RepID=UPI0004179223|nr:MFS transporter [Thalassobaculum salexigens]